MKVNITFNDELMERVDAFAAQNYMTRSGLISYATTQFLNGAQMMSAIQEMALCMRKIADNGIVDDETMQKLEDIERFVKFVSQSK